MRPGKKYRNKVGEEYLCVSWQDQIMVENPSQFMQANYSPLLLLAGKEPVKGIQVLVLNSIAHEDYAEVSE